MSPACGKSIAAVLTALLISSSGALAADLIGSEAPRVASHRYVPAPACDHHCKRAKVCDDLVLTYPEKTEIVAVCYKPAY